LVSYKPASNIADDLIVHGKTKEEHDERLTAVWMQPCEAASWLILNQDKCQFKMNKFELMGHLTSDSSRGSKFFGFAEFQFMI
jgi:hypothetical protein